MTEYECGLQIVRDIRGVEQKNLQVLEEEIHRLKEEIFFWRVAL